jgi:hypothetical protein
LVDVCHGGCGNGVVSILADVWLVPLLVNNFRFFLFGILGCWENLRFGFFNRRCMRMNADERGCVERDVEWMRK